MALSMHGFNRIRVLKLSFDLQFKNQLKIEKIVVFDFCTNTEYGILTLKRNFRSQLLEWKTNF